MSKNYKIYTNTNNSQISNDTNELILENFTKVEWRASFMMFRPKGIKFSWLWVLYYFLFFFDKNYRGLLLYNKNKKLVHSVFLIPKYFRFRFMEKNSLQVSNIWTSNCYRNKGLATAVLKFIIKTNSHKKIWYICRQDNIASAKVAENAGLRYNGLCLKQYILFFSFYK